MRRVFITGCARSGTTLLNRLFYAFEGVAVIDAETSLDDLCARELGESVIVAKRTPRTILSVPLPEPELLRQAVILTSGEICVINLIRDGRDVVHRHATGPRVNVNRWIGCMLQAQRFKKLITLLLRYEDLVVRPDDVQAEIVRATGLRRRVPFSAYPDFVPAHVFDEPDFREFQPYRRRPIDQESVGHSPTEYVGLCTSDEERSLFERTLARFGYLAEPAQEIWDASELASELALFDKISAHRKAAEDK